MSPFTEKYNIHTHSFYCGHGSGTISDYFREGLRQGLETLGFSEHCPFPDGFLSRSRMDYGMRTSYESDVRSLKGGAMTVALGYECDYFPKYKAYFEDLRDSVDYLITGTHFIIRPDGSRVSPFSDRLTQDDLLRYRDQLLAALDTGLFDCIAHPDLYMAGYSDWDETAQGIAREIISAAVSRDLPLEVNANGLLKPRPFGRVPYPYGPFFDLVHELGAPVFLSTDAHKVANLVRNRDVIEDFARSRRLRLLRPSFPDGQLCWTASEGTWRGEGETLTACGVAERQ